MIMLLLAVLRKLTRPKLKSFARGYSADAHAVVRGVVSVCVLV